MLGVMAVAEMVFAPTALMVEEYTPDDAISCAVLV